MPTQTKRPRPSHATAARMPRPYHSLVATSSHPDEARQMFLPSSSSSSPVMADEWKTEHLPHRIVEVEESEAAVSTTPTTRRRRNAVSFPQHQQPPPQPLLQHLIRPIAMLPQDAEAFYEEACCSTKLQLTLPMVHQAVQASHLWHRQWTTEAGRWEAAALRRNNDTNDPQQPPPFVLDRCRNPSPQSNGSTSNDEDDDEEEDDMVRSSSTTARRRRPIQLRSVHKRGREGSLLAQNLSSQNQNNQEPVPKEEEEPATAVTTTTALIRPRAMRIAVQPVVQHNHHHKTKNSRVSKDDDADHRLPHRALRPSQSTLLVPRTSGGTLIEEEAASPSQQQQQRQPPCSHFAIPAAAAERTISPLTLDADLFQDEDILQTVVVEDRTTTAPAMIVEDDDDDDEPSVLTMFLDDNDEDNPILLGSRNVRSSPSALLLRHRQQQQAARERLLQELAVTGGETTSEVFQSALQILQQPTSHGKQSSSMRHTGLWLTLTKPTFFDCLGENGHGDPLYTLGRMSFGLCAPTDLVCSLQGNFNRLERVTTNVGAVPKSLRPELLLDTCQLETYDIITAFTIEPHSPAFPNAPNRDVTRPIRGLMTTYGYIIPDPLTPNRYTVWITGGRLEPNPTPADNVTAWQQLFAAHPPQHTLAEHAKLLAVQWLMGATLPRVVDSSTGAREYTFERPLGGHGVTYLDNLYTDESLRIWRGHRGTTFVLARTER